MSPLRRVLALISPDLKPQKALVAGGTIAVLAEVVFRAAEPWPMKLAVDALAAALGVGSGRAADGFTLLALGLVLVGIVALRALCNYLATVAFALAGSRTAARLRARVFAHVQGLNQQFHARNRSADTVQRIVGDIARMQDVAVTAGLPLAANVLTLLVMLVVMFVMDPVLAAVVLIAVAVFAVLSPRRSRLITAAARRTRRSEGHLANTAQESLGAIRVVQAYGLERILLGRFVGANAASLKQGVKSLRLAAGLERSTDVVVGLAMAVVMVGGGLRVLDGAMSLGDLVLFTSYLRTTMKPLRDMAKYTGRIARATASGERVVELMDVAPGIASAVDAVKLPVARGELTFTGVHTAYEGREVLHGIDLTVSSGERVALVGPSGAGKSTLASLVVRALDPTSGTVSLDGVPLTDLDLAWLRGQVSVLHQEAVLFTGTIAENIRLGRPDATDEEVVEAAKAACAHDFITELPGGYAAEVGERGGTLSGGQRQRIAIARALLRPSPVVVLDEATTGLDPASAELVLAAIDRLAVGRTLLAVTHDAAVALHCDRVVWIEDGRTLLDGSPDHLLATSDVFRAWAQAGEAMARSRS